MKQPTKQVEIEGLDEPVTIWKLNYGFQQDYNDVVAKLDTDTETVNISSGRANLYWIVFGVYEAEELGFPEIKDTARGFDDKELRDREVAARRLSRDVGQKLQKKIMEFNGELDNQQDQEAELEKK